MTSGGLGKERSEFGEWLDRRGIKQQFVADESGVSRGTISQLATDPKRSPTYKNAMKIEKALKRVDDSFEASHFWDL